MLLVWCLRLRCFLCHDGPLVERNVFAQFLWQRFFHFPRGIFISSEISGESEFGHPKKCTDCRKSQMVSYFYSGDVFRPYQTTFNYFYHYCHRRGCGWQWPQGEEIVTIRWMEMAGLPSLGLPHFFEISVVAQFHTVICQWVDNN